MVTLSIIILSYNTKDLTLKCIGSLVGQYKKELERGELEIIVVDNDSKDGTIEILKRVQNDKRDSGSSTRMTQNGNITIVKNKENLGFAKGCNIGGMSAKGKYILFLNSDTEVLDNGFLQMIKFLDNHKDVGLLGGKLLNPNGSPQPSAGKFYSLFNLFFMLIGIENFLRIRKSPNAISKIDWVSGGCMMIKKDLFQKLSGFDENFFMYIEDMELCYRAGKHGFATFFYPDCKTKHISLGSGNKTFAIINIYKGILYFYSKHKSHFEYIVAKLLLIAKAVILIFIGTISLNESLKERYKKALNF